MTPPSDPRQRLQRALQLHRDGQLEQAERGYLELLALQPDAADALHLLGVLCHQLGRHGEAVQRIQAALVRDAGNPDYLNNLGLALRADGQLQRAVDSYRQALQVAPGDTDLLINLGNALQELGQFPQCIDCYRRVLRLQPQDGEVRAALGLALQAQGLAAQQAGDYALAAHGYQQALQLAPNDAALHYNLGNALRALARPQEAADSYSRALALTPGDAEIHNNLGNVLRELGHLQQAMDCYRQALVLDPDLYHARVHLIHQQQHACDWQDLEQGVAQVRAWVRQQPQAQVSPFAFLAMPGTTMAEQRLCADHWLANRYAPLQLQAAQLAFKHVPAQTGRLRIAYLSGDFRLHPLASLITELIELHDRSRFEIYAYSYSQPDDSPQCLRLQQAFDHWLDIRPLSHEQAARRIHADGIDILVDLTGFTQGSRTALVALRPAPLAVSWLGFPGTMGELAGKPLFDYVLADATVIPDTHKPCYAEQVARLPCYQPNDRQRLVAALPTRAEAGLPAQGLVFCCFNQSYKMTPAVFALWMRLLQQVPGSVLWLLHCNQLATDNLRGIAQQHGLDPQRLIFAPRVAMDQHLARQALADLVLDTLPYNAHTTTSDALWMGVPVLTCLGDTFAGRVAASLLRAAGLPELVTPDLQAYEALALQLARDPGQLQALRHQLAQPAQLPLFDTTAYARRLEQCYLQMQQAKGGPIADVLE